MSRHDHDLRSPTPALERARTREHARRRQHAQITGVPPTLDVHVDDLAEGELEVDTLLPAAALSELLDEGKEIEWTATGDARIALRLEREAGFVRVRGRASFALRHPCVRCLNAVPFEVPLDVDLRRVRREAVDAKAPEAEHSDEDLEEVSAAGDLDDLGIASFVGDTIHLADVLREQLYLELPMHPACDSPRARPTAPCAFDEAGALHKEQARWVDPRWAGLAKLKDQLAAGPAPAPAARPAASAAELVALPGRQTPVALPSRAAPRPKAAGGAGPLQAPPAATRPLASKPATQAPVARPAPTPAPKKAATAPKKAATAPKKAATAPKKAATASTAKAVKKPTKAPSKKAANKASKAAPKKVAKKASKKAPKTKARPRR